MRGFRDRLSGSKLSYMRLASAAIPVSALSMHTQARPGFANEARAGRHWFSPSGGPAVAARSSASETVWISHSSVLT